MWWEESFPPQFSRQASRFNFRHKWNALRIIKLSDAMLARVQPEAASGTLSLFRASGNFIYRLDSFNFLTGDSPFYWLASFHWIDSSHSNLLTWVIPVNWLESFRFIDLSHSGKLTPVIPVYWLQSIQFIESSNSVNWLESFPFIDSSHSSLLTRVIRVNWLKSFL
jgi:hypothetical protein